jgi:hypothetical protein
MSKRISGAEPVEYLRWFTARGWGLNVIEEETGQLRSFPTPEALVEWWPASLHGEDLLLIPSSDCR